MKQNKRKNLTPSRISLSVRKSKHQLSFCGGRGNLAEREEREKSVCIFVISNILHLPDMLLLLQQMMIEKTLAL